MTQSPESLIPYVFPVALAILFGYGAARRFRRLIVLLVARRDGLTIMIDGRNDGDKA